MKKIKEILIKFKNLDPAELEIFMAEILGKDKSFVIAHSEYKLSLFQYLKLIYFIYQRKKGYSVAAIVTHKEFYGLNFYVNKHVLIPRPDTEIMVDETIAEIKKSAGEIILIDVGAGSGCIPIAIACHAEFISASQKIPKQVRNDIQIFAIDISISALQVAKKNAKKYNIDIQFLHGNLLEPIIHNSKLINHNSAIIITANLPYLTEKQFQTEPSIQREPKKALIAKNNGLALYEELLQQIKFANFAATIFLEIDPSQSEEIVKIIKQYFPKANMEIKKDLAGLDRLVKIIN